MTPRVIDGSLINQTAKDTMNKNSNQKRSRNRGGSGRRSGPSRNHVFESNGPEVKVRGTAQQVLDKYLQLARDAQSSGDRIRAEGLLQYAEHYFRIISAEVQNNPTANTANEARDAGEGEAEVVKPEVVQPADSEDGDADAPKQGRSRARRGNGRAKAQPASDKAEKAAASA